MAAAGTLEAAEPPGPRGAIPEHVAALSAIPTVGQLSSMSLGEVPCWTLSSHGDSSSRACEPAEFLAPVYRSEAENQSDYTLFKWQGLAISHGLNKIQTPKVEHSNSLAPFDSS